MNPYIATVLTFIIAAASVLQNFYGRREKRGWDIERFRAWWLMTVFVHKILANCLWSRYVFSIFQRVTCISMSKPMGRVMSGEGFHQLL